MRTRRIISPRLRLTASTNTSVSCPHSLTVQKSVNVNGLQVPMAPKSSAVQQRTISSFFTPKPSSSNTSSKSNQRTPATTQPNGTQLNLSGRFALPAPIPRESSTKRKSDGESSHGSDVENIGPEAKRQKTAGLSNGIQEVGVSSTGSTTKENNPRSGEQTVERRLPVEENVAALPLSSSRTAKYVFSSPANAEQIDEEPETEQRLKDRRRMHERFVKKLGRPDSLAEIRRKNGVIENDSAEQAAEDDDDEGEDNEDQDDSGRRGSAAKKKTAEKLTPMVKQYLDLKRQHLDKVIIYQVGYKYLFYGEDARIAAKNLSIVCINGKYRYDEHPSEAHLTRLASASIPIARLHVHVKRLVAAGHKVGVVNQIETAALKKVGDNRNTPFVRKLTHVYTQGTYVDDMEGLNGEGAGTSATGTGYLLCLTEKNAGGVANDENVHVGIVAVQPTTGVIIYDDFQDGFMRSELETRLLHIAPCEYLIIGDLSPATQKLIKHLSGSKSNVFGIKARVEHKPKQKTSGAESFSHVTSFYANKLRKVAGDSTDEVQVHKLDKVTQLPEAVTICLSSMINHLTEYGLEHVFDLTSNFQSFSTRTHMTLNGNTLNSLEIYSNQTDQEEKGSLFWKLDHTKTRFGKRLLRSWVGRPLLDKSSLEARIEAVEEINNSHGTRESDRLKRVLNRIKGDLEKIILRIYYKRASRPEVLSFLQSMQRISDEYAHVSDAEHSGWKSTELQRVTTAIPLVGEHVVNLLNRVRMQSAKEDDKYNFFREEYESEKILDHKLGIAAVEHDLNEHRAPAASTLGRKVVEYVTVAGIEYLIEVENSKTASSKVPASWIKISNTKKCSRFHTPEVVKLIRERDQHKESLAAACDEAFERFMDEISEQYQMLRDCIRSIATLDCLSSLAEVASQPGYCKPEFVEHNCIEIVQGRHPMVEQLLLDAYVPNDISLAAQELSSAPDTTGGKATDPSAMLITGPNMGGKSSYVRSVALIAIMAQIGSYVPATSARLGMLDAVFTRMGAFDNMMRGESTFMVELGETSDILKQATRRSLVILDELGRGTSTHDGVAIAEAVLRELVQRGVMTLFITHYQDLARIEASCRGRLRNVHVKFEESGGGGEQGSEEVTFLYEVGEGVAHRSYGLNVARLANVPKAIVDVAAVKSREMEAKTVGKKSITLGKLVGRVMACEDEAAMQRLMIGIEQL